MYWEEQLTSYKLDQNTAYRPKITRFFPITALKKYLRTTILSCIYNWTVRLRTMCCSTEVDQFNSRVFGNHYFWIRISLLFIIKLIIKQQNVLRFEVSMSIAMFMQKPYTFKQLSCKRLHIVGRIPFVFILLDDIVEWRSKLFENNTKMIMMKEMFDIAY